MNLIDFYKDKWANIPEFEGYYQVNMEGTIKSLEREIVDKVGHVYTIPERILKSNINNQNGYLQTGLSVNNKKSMVYNHKIEIAAFVPNENNLPVVNHKDGDKLNLTLTNLEYTDYSGNNQHAYDTGLKPKGENFYNSKLTETSVREIRELYNNNESYSNMAKMYNVSRATIRDVCLGKTWKGV